MSSYHPEFVNALTLSCLPSPSPFRQLQARRLIGAAVDHQRPGVRAPFIGERHRHDLKGPPRLELRSQDIS
jgi:hypothetical protein